MIIDTTPTETSAAAGPNAVDLATPVFAGAGSPAMPLMAYNRGWEDACYQAVYYNCYEDDSNAWREYDRGHEDGMAINCSTICGNRG